MYQGDGLYKLYNHSSFYSNGRYCLDLEGIHTNNIDLWNNCSEDYVLFNIFSNGDGTYRIQNYWPKSPKVLTVSSTSTSNVYNSDWSTSSKQRWVFEARSSKAVTAHSGQIQVGMSADNFGSSRNDTTCGYGFVVSTHTADGFGSSLLLDERINLKFYHLNYGSNHSAVWATKNDFLSKEYHSITDPNIDDVHFMLFVGHGLGKMLHFSHGPAGTNHADNKSQHFLTDLNFTLAEANFGYGDAITK